MARDKPGRTRREAIATITAGMLSAPLLAAPKRRRRAPAAPMAKPPLPCPVRTPLDAIAMRLLALAPETATLNGVATALDGGPAARAIDDCSPAGEAAWRSALAQAEQDVAAIACAGDPRGSLQLAVARAVMANATRSAGVPYGRIRAFDFSGHVPYLVTPVAGPHIDTPDIMASQQSLSTPAAVDAWLAKLDGFPAAFAGVIEKLRADEAAGCRVPRVLLEKALPVIDAFLAGPADAHPLVAALRRRTEAAGLDERRRAAAAGLAATLIDKRARPAFAKLRAAVAELAVRGRDEAGVWAQPEGDALYAANVRALGDTSLAPEEIHRIGLSEVARIGARMDALLRARGRTRGSVGGRLAALGQDPRNLFPDNDAGREALLEEVRGLVRAMERRYPQILPAGLIPRQPLEVMRVPIATQAGAPGGFYSGPSMDGARPGTYWINLRDMAAAPRFRLPTLSYHEGVPGHHMQGSIAVAAGEAPLLLRIASFNAYQEGWALYAEGLAAELGAYARDPLGDLGRLQDELFRSVRLVADTGLHHARWSRERAIGYMREATGVAESRVTAEVERYMAWPGQALGYKLGQMRLTALRAKANAKLGKRFSRRAFHGQVLAQGPMPLDLVEAVVLGAR